MAASSLTTRRLKIVRVGIAVTLPVLAIAALLLLSYGWGMLRPLAERRASAALGRPVSIARIRRVGGGLLHPLLAIDGVRIAQPAWAGGGDMLRLRSARVRVAALQMLVGRPDPRVILIEGLRASLVRSPAGKASWERERPETDKDRALPDFGQLVVRNAIVALEDRRYQHRFTMRVAIDARGFRLNGTGSVGGTPATIAVSGPTVAGSAPWPFQAEVASPAVTLRAAGRMRTPLDLGHFTVEAESRGRNLVDLDHLTEAGLPASQPFHLRAMIEHDRPTWIVTDLRGTIGRSDIAGHVSVGKKMGRVLLDGSLHAERFDFDDLATDAQLAQATAQARKLGPRMFPPTRIRLDMLRSTDGMLRIDIRHLLSRTPTVFRTLTTTLRLDHGVLTAAPISAALTKGRLSGSAIVRHPSGMPLMLLDLRLSNSEVEGMIPTAGIVSGPLVGRFKLSGRGGTFREAMAHSEGRAALATSGGTITRRVALFLGGDVGRGLFAGNSDRGPVRCIVGSFALRGGIARPDPLVFDSPLARADASGTVDLASEAIALDFHGLPKRAGAIRLNGPIQERGTLEAPTFNPPPQTRTVGGILSMVGKALGGGHAPLGQDADCAGLAARALR